MKRWNLCIYFPLCPLLPTVGGGGGSTEIPVMGGGGVMEIPKRYGKNSYDEIDIDSLFYINNVLVFTRFFNTVNNSIIIMIILFAIQQTIEYNLRIKINI